jgi:polysaccharide pyruvyl transferase WcaK-like protein
MKIAILNVKYSPNLGDGIIAECIEDQLARRIDGLDIFSLDIGGKDDYGSGGSIFGEKMGLMGRVRKLPDSFQAPIKKYLMPLAVNAKYGKDWESRVKSCDALIIGGGHLFMDVDQYFPMRLMTAALRTRKGTPIAVYAVGVSKKMTSAGRQMFERIFKHGKLIDASVRDVKSRDNWQDHFGKGDVRINPDPGLLCVQTYGVQEKPLRSEGRKAVCFGVSDPASMRPHSDSVEGVVCGDIDFYLDTLKLITPQYDVSMFTNGEDDEYLAKISAAIKDLPQSVQDRVKVLPRAVKPIELVRQITSADAMIAHRLHANIISYSYQIPHIGLGWDEKLKSFFSIIERPDFIITSNQDAPSRVSALLNRALKEGIDRATHQRILASAAQGIDMLASALSENISHQKI